MSQQNNICWNHFVCDRIIKNFTRKMKEHYFQLIKKKHKFTGIGWIRKVIEHMLNSHIEAWKNRCDIIFNHKTTNVNNKLIPLHKNTFLLAIK